jgi:hypothetical protein
MEHFMIHDTKLGCGGYKLRRQTQQQFNFALHCDILYSKFIKRSDTIYGTVVDPGGSHTVHCQLADRRAGSWEINFVRAHACRDDISSQHC